MLKITAEGHIHWFKKLYGDINLAALEVKGDLYINIEKSKYEKKSTFYFRMFNVLPDELFAANYSMRWDAHAQDEANFAQNAKTKNPFADFEKKLKLGQDGKILASDGFLLAWLELKSYKIIDRLLPVFEKNGVSTEDFKDLKSEMKNSDVRLSTMVVSTSLVISYSSNIMMFF